MTIQKPLALPAGPTCDCFLDEAMFALDALGLDDERAFTRKGNSIKVKAPADLIRSELSDAYVVTANSRNTCTVTVRP